MKLTPTQQDTIHIDSIVMSDDLFGNKIIRLMGLVRLSMQAVVKAPPDRWTDEELTILLKSFSDIAGDIIQSRDTATKVTH